MSICTKTLSWSYVDIWIEVFELVIDFFSTT